MDNGQTIPLVYPVIPPDDDEPRPRLTEIKKLVCQRFRISRLDIESERLTGEIVYARHVYCWLARLNTTASLRMIGDRVGGRDHTTVHHAIRRIEQRAADSEIVRGDLALLQSKISAIVQLRRA
jgi:chromosomal replication initiator protein